jgi:hypothetical protein
MREFSSARPVTDGPEENPLAGVKFTLDGKVFECKGRMNLLEGSILASIASEDEGMVVSDAATMSAVADYLRVAFGDTEFHRFRVHVRTHQTPSDVLLEIMNDIRLQTEANVAAIAERPTVPPPVSSDGPGGRDAHIARVISLQHGDVSVTPGGQPVDPALALERSEQEAARAAARKGGKAKGGSSSGGRAHRTG